MDLKVPLRNQGWAFAFAGLLTAHFALARLGWADTASVEGDFRQAQTAISTYFIQKEHNFHLAYPTPVLGKPWSIPMEFPLYQWAVAKLVIWLDWPLIATGRSVSLACFYLTLPAWFLLLRSAGVPLARRWAVLMVVLTCPVYLFWSRSFLIESMALMFASWHAFFVIETLHKQRWPWLLTAVTTGMAAALTKITTWAAVLLPCTLFALWLLRQSLTSDPRGRRPGARLVVWGSGAVLPALLAGWGWVQFADMIKARNPGAHFLNSVIMLPFNFGTLALRLSPEFWARLYEHWTTVLVPGIALLFILIAGLWLRGPWRALIGLCLAGFLGSQLLFSHLYYAHAYYFFANGFMLVIGLGLAGCHVLDHARLPAWLKAACWLGLLAAGSSLYLKNFLPNQRMVLTAPTGLTQAIQVLTGPDDVLVILGEDWSSETPFAARRRALMVPAGRESDDHWWQASLDRLAGERIALLIVTGKARFLPDIVQRRLTALGMQPQPLFTYRNRSDVYLSKQLLHQALAVLRGAAFADVDLPAMSLLPAGAQQFDWHRDRAAFLVLTPFPVRYDTPYGAPPWLEYEGVPVFIAHVPTTLEFNVPAGARHLTLVFGMVTDAYLRHSSDGAGIIVELTDPAGRTREIWQRQLNPRKRAEDRLRLTATIPLPVPFDGRLIIRTHPGPNQNMDYDWVYFSEITIR